MKLGEPDCLTKVGALAFGDVSPTRLSDGGNGYSPDIWNIRYWFAIAVVSKSEKESLCPLSYFPTRYKTMAPDSQIVKSLFLWSIIVGRRPFGFFSVYDAFL